MSTGCQWRAIPKDLPPRGTLFDDFDLWTYDGTLDRIHHALYVACREQDEREASPTAAIIDSQSAKSAELFGKLGRGACINPHGYDAGKKINGKTRHILVDTLGLLLHANVHPADIQDHDGGILCKSRDLRFRALSRESGTCHSSLGAKSWGQVLGPSLGAKFGEMDSIPSRTRGIRTSVAGGPWRAPEKPVPWPVACDGRSSEHPKASLPDSTPSRRSCLAQAMNGAIRH